MSLSCRYHVRTAVDELKDTQSKTVESMNPRRHHNASHNIIDLILSKNRTHKYIYGLQGKHKPM